MFNDGSKDAKTLKMMWTVVKNTGGSGHGYRKSREQHIPHVCYGHGKRELAVPKIEKTVVGWHKLMNVLETLIYYNSAGHHTNYIC